MPVEPQVFDLLVYLIRNRDRVVSKDDLIAAIWHGRIVSESALTNRINGARTAVGDSGGEQRLIKTLFAQGCALRRSRAGGAWVCGRGSGGSSIAPSRSA